jgi:hypothetical protein
MVGRLVAGFIMAETILIKNVISIRKNQLDGAE